MFRHPWHATNHCNTTFPEFLEREWSPGRLAGKLHFPNEESLEASSLSISLLQDPAKGTGGTSAVLPQLRICTAMPSNSRRPSG